MPEDRPSFPDRLEDRHIAPRGGFHRHASVISVAVLGALMAAALAGVFGGHAPDDIVVEGGGVRLRITFPETIRNGEFFETEFEVTARTNVEDCVLALSPSLIRRLTQNSMIPAAADETFEDGLYAFSYGPLSQGETLNVKADFQINPDLFLGNAGSVTVRDGTRRMAEAAVTMRVWP